MSTVRALNGVSVIQINVSDRLPEEGAPSDFYKSMLDAVNGQACFYGWRGVTFEHVCFSRETRVFSVTVGRGSAPATLHLMRRHIAETTADGRLDDA